LRVTFGVSLALFIAAVAAALPASAQNTQAAQATALVEPRPTWADLNPAEQAALAPLRAQWPGLSSGHKLKWQELAKDFARLSPQDQARLQERMREWAALTPQQRNAARLNFNDAAHTLTPEARREKWEAYQALPPQERQALADQGKPPKSAALGFKPAERERLAEVPAPANAAASGKARPRIEVPASAPR
jgi:Protein of unknown function (DUF3106)